VLAKSKVTLTIVREANQRLVVAGLREQELADVAERARRRATFLAEVSRRLSETFDAAEVGLRDIARLAVPIAADCCLIDVLATKGGAGAAAEGEATLQRVGWAHAEFTAQAWFDEARRHVPPEHWQAHPIIEALATGAPVVVPEITEAWLRTAAPDPAHRWFLRRLGLRSLLTLPLVGGGRRLGAMTFGRTVTSSRQSTVDDLTLAEDLAGRVALALDNARLCEALRQAVQLRDDFLAATVHDLNNPLTVVTGQAQLLRQQLARAAAGAPAAGATASGLLSVKLVAQVEAGLAQIETTATRMARLIGALPDVSHLEASHVLQLDKHPTDLVALVRRVADEHQLDAKGHRIRVEMPEQDFVGQWDGARLERALDNLLSNALKYSPGGGDVVVSLTRSGGASDEVVLAVQDRGMGIPAADLPRLFERSYRGANVRGRVSGSGIGLAVVHQVVAEHGGTISVESHEPDAWGHGGGSTFTVRLPVGHPPDADAARHL
jgi:signal transduction histidine kinase